MGQEKPQHGLVVLILVTWLAIATGLSAFGLIAQLVPPVPQILLAILTVGCVLAMWRIKLIKAWALHVDTRLLVGFHLVRFVGFYFLFLQTRGQLPTAFATPAGWGDIVVAGAAVVLLGAGPPIGKLRTAYLVWNVVGLADIMLVVSIAARLAILNQNSMANMLRLPLSLLITFLVPLIIASHLLLLYRLDIARRT